MRPHFSSVLHRSPPSCSLYLIVINLSRLAVAWKWRNGLPITVSLLTEYPSNSCYSAAVTAQKWAKFSSIEQKPDPKCILKQKVTPPAANQLLSKRLTSSLPAWQVHKKAIHIYFCSHLVKTRWTSDLTLFNKCTFVSEHLTLTKPEWGFSMYNATAK